MNANNIVGHFFRVIDDVVVSRSLSPNAYVVLLYLYRRFALTQDNPVIWDHEEADIDLRTLQGAQRELVHFGLALESAIGAYVLLNPKTRELLVYPNPRKRFAGIRTFRFPWFVLDYRRLNATELKVYACLWAEKNHRVYLTDSDIASKTAMSERTVRRCLQSLRKQGMIACRTEDRAWFTKIKNKSMGLLNTLTWADPLRMNRLEITPVTRIRQITLCDPERPGIECTPRTFLRQWIDFNEIRDGDVLRLLHKLGVKVLHDSGAVIRCEIQNAIRTNDVRKVDPKTGFSLVPTEKRNRKGRRKALRESIWELAYRYKGEDGYGIVRGWYNDLIKRNVMKSVVANDEALVRIGPDWVRMPDGRRIQDVTEPAMEESLEDITL